MVMSSLRLQLADVAPDRAARLRVESHRRLVEEQHARRVQQAARDLQASPHSAGVRVREAAPPLPQPDHLHHLAHAAVDELARHAVELGVQAQVLLGRQVPVERRLLEDQADVAADVVAFGEHVVSGHERRAAAGTHERAQHPDRRRLARSVGAQEAEDLAAGDLEVDAPHGLHLGVALGQPFDGDGRAARAVERRHRGRGRPVGHARTGSAPAVGRARRNPGRADRVVDAVVRRGGLCGGWLAQLSFPTVSPSCPASCPPSPPRSPSVSPSARIR